MIVRKRLILTLLMIFLELNLKFIHDTKKNLKKINKKHRRGFKNKSQFHNYNSISPVVKDIIINKTYKDKKIKSLEGVGSHDENLFEIDEALIEKGADFLFALKENNKIFNNNDYELEKINIGSLSISYSYVDNEKDNKQNNEGNDLQKFIENHAADLLILFVIKSFIVKNNINIFFKDQKKITQAEIKFKRKFFKGDQYSNIKLLENNLNLYKKILLMLILNILDEDNNAIKVNLIDKVIQIIFSKNLFYKNELLKKQFISKLKEIESLNKNFNITDYESILYFLAYYIKEQPDEFFKFILDKDFLKFVLFNINFNDVHFQEKNENVQILEQKKLEDLEGDFLEKKNKMKEELKMKEFSGIMKYYLSILQNLLK